MLLAALGLLVVLALVDLVRIKLEIDRGRDRLDELDLDAAAADGGIERVIDDAADHLDRAEEIADSSPWLSVVGAVPGARAQVEAVRDLTGASRRLGDVARGSAAELTDGLELAEQSPAGRVALVDIAIAEIDRVSTFLADLDYGADGFLVPPFAQIREAFADEIVESTEELADARASASALRRMLAGPSRYLLLAANNAEMTVAAGMTNSLGIATIQDGDIDVPGFLQSSEVWLGYDGVRSPGDFDRLYGKVAMGVDFRGTTSSPNFPVVGNLLARMAERKPQLGKVDGVFVVDALLLRDIVELTGPVEVAGRRYDADNIVAEILNRNYVAFPNFEDRNARTELQSDVAVAVFEKLKSSAIGLAELANVLKGAAEGRHLLAWSEDHDLENLWRDFGAAGQIRPDSLGIHLENYGGNKLDYYYEPTAQLHLATDPEGSGDWQARLAVSLTNVWPEEVADTFLVGFRPDRHVAFLNLLLPAGVYDIQPVYHEFEGVGKDGPNNVVALFFQIPKGDTTTVLVDFKIPRDLDTVELIPSARIHPLVLRIAGKTYTDGGPVTIKLEDPPPLPLTGLAAHPALVLGALLALAGALLAIAGYAAAQRRGRQARSRADLRLAMTLVAAAAALVVMDLYRIFEPFDL